MDDDRLHDDRRPAVQGTSSVEDLSDHNTETNKTPIAHHPSHLKVIAVVVGSGHSDGRSRSGGDGASHAKARAGNGVLGSIDAVIGIIRDSSGDDCGSAHIQDSTLSSASGLVIDGESDGAEDSHVSLFVLPSCFFRAWCREW